MGYEGVFLTAAWEVTTEENSEMGASTSTVTLIISSFFWSLHATEVMFWDDIFDCS